MKSIVTLVAASIFSANAHAGPVEKYAFSVQDRTANLRACASLDSSSISLATDLNQKYFELLDVADIQLVDPDLHFRKIDAIYSLVKTAVTAKNCENVSILARRGIGEMDADIAKLKKRGRR